MEDTKRKKRYLHQANAFATTGRIDRPFCDLIPTQAPVTLPQSGGYVTARAEGFRYKEVLSFASAYAEVGGSEHGPDGPFDTLALSVIEKLNILDVVTCDRVVARISSKRDLDAEEPEITTVGSRFERLRVGNHFFEILDLGAGVLCECITWKSVLGALQDGKKRDALGQAALSAPDGTKVSLPSGKQTPAKLGFSLAPGCGRSSSVKEVPSRISVPQFGTVHLGEIFISQYMRQVLMLRVELGCPLSGSGGGGGTSGGGDIFP